MGRSLTRVLLAGILLLSFATSLAAYPKTLTPEDIQSAIEYGKSRRGKALIDRGHPNYIPFTLVSFAFVFTPWLQLASRAQDAAAKYQELSQVDVERILQRATGRLEIEALVTDDTQDFWRDPHAVIMQDTMTIQPATKRGVFQNIVSCSSRPCTITAALIFVFPDDQLDISKKAELVVILRGGYKERRVSLNLPMMR